MRNLLLACLFFFAAAGLLACSDPARTARREVDRVTRITQRTETNLKRATRAALLEVGQQEGQARGQALKAAGCGNPATQPGNALPALCRAVVVASQARYEARVAAITTPAKRVDATIGAVYASLLVVLDVLEDVEAGLRPGGWQVKLAQLVAQAVKLYSDAVAAYDAWKTAVGGAP